MLMEFVFVLFSLLTGEDDTMSCSLFFIALLELKMQVTLSDVDSPAFSIESS